MNAYHNNLGFFAENAAFLWLLRSMAVNQSNYSPADLMVLEQRVDAQLDGLMVSPEESWEICAEAMALEQAGEIFAAAVVAFRSGDINKIQQAVVAGVANDQTLQGLTSALGWLPDEVVHPWMKRFLTSKDLNHKHVALAVCGARREDPREYLTAILQREDCLEHKKLYACALRLIGELKRFDLLPALRIAQKVEHPDIAFWSNWSAILLGDISCVDNLRETVMQEGPHQARALQICFRVLPVEVAREWINSMAKNPALIRPIIKATAILGDPYAVPWLIGQMQVPALARLAGEAFTSITGIYLEENNLALETLPAQEPLPSDDPEDAEVAMDRDEHLAYPDVDKISAVWQHHQQRFISGQRYFLGQIPSIEQLQAVFAQASQGYRAAAALELSLLDANQFLLNHACKGTLGYE